MAAPVPMLLTLDVDWASDAIVSPIIDELVEHQVRATWFITHDSPATRRLLATPELFEVGLHPNFAVGSTHGASPEQVMRHLKTIAPAARAVRTHGLLQSTALLRTMHEQFAVEIDASLYLPGGPVIPHDLHLHPDIPPLCRVPFSWEDDLEMARPDPAFAADDPRLAGRLHLFNFHPIHIALNSCTFAPYQSCKQSVDIGRCTPADIERFANRRAPGAGTLFRELVRALATCGGSRTLTQFVAAWRAGAEGPDFAGRPF
jgi:hypothetical protein